MDNYQLAYDQAPTTVLTFILAGDALDPDEITQAVGLSPDDAWSKGMLQGGKYPKPTGQWRLYPGCSRDEPFETQLNLLLDRLEACAPVLRTYVERFNGVMSVGYSSGEDTIGFFIDHTTMQRLARLGLQLWFDIYAIREHDTDDADETSP